VRKIGNWWVVPVLHDVFLMRESERDSVKDGWRKTKREYLLEVEEKRNDKKDLV